MTSHIFESLQLALGTNHLKQASTITQNDLASLVLGHETDLLKAIRLRTAHTPNLSRELVSRTNRRSETSLELFQVGRIATTKLTQNTVCSRVPAKETVNDNAAEAHLLTGLRSGVERIVVTIQADQESA